MKYLRLLLWPFSLVYGLVIVIRSWCYDAGWLKSTSFNFPVITIGNLAVGGAGKSPMTEYLIGLLKDSYKIATVSRGYGRKTKGFVLANMESTTPDIGDEPAQFKHKFPDVTVAVCEDRVAGINKLKNDNEVILLDDAFQHRAVKAGLNLLLFDYNKLQQLNLLLPAGNLREPFSGKIRADIFVVTKCPEELSIEEQDKIYEQLKPYPYQSIFFTRVAYLPLKRLYNNDTLPELKPGTTILLLTGIAGAGPLVQYFTHRGLKVIHHNYPDHHAFTLKNITKLAEEFKANVSADKIIITTEKDAERLNIPGFEQVLSPLKVLVQPIGVSFLNDGKVQFDQLIENYVRKYTTHSSVH